MPHDAALMPFISSANIACGYHAGDKNTMLRTIELCVQHSVAIGAHPGFQDKPNFGRNPIQLSQKALYDLIIDQLQELNEICKIEGAVLHHVKPHGALYNMAAGDKEMSKMIALAVFDFNPKLIYYGLSGSVMLAEAKRFGLQTAHEAFADRTYLPDGSLTSRNDEHALIKDESVAMKQALQMIKEGKVETIDHTFIPIQAETICIHGDGEFAVQFAKTIHQQLKQEGIIIRSIQKTV